MHAYFTDKQLIQSPPVKRAAYSDRTAWIMAEISRLVYEQLPDEVSIEALVAEIRQAVERGEATDVIAALVAQAGASRAENSVIETVLREARFELLETFAVAGTEAILARLGRRKDFDGMLVLAFRGTQPSIRDVLTDIRADLVSDPLGGRVHRGFRAAFEKVRAPMEQALAQHAGPPVYITGHSLGGALALLATRYLGADSTGACYTFGCPRAGDDAFFAGIKTPVYRIVNAADGVARVPFGSSLSALLSVIRLIPINGTRRISEWLRRHFLGYTHYGNMIFLSAAPNVPDAHGIGFAGLTVTSSADIFVRARVVVPRLLATRLRAAARDHAMLEYSLKLLAHAQRRN